MDEPPHLVLIGMMGAGKTSVGRRLGARLGRPFLDTDQLVEERAGRTIAAIFETDGEPAFRALEAAAVRDVLGSGTPAVVAFGGGAVLDPATRALARSRGLVVWLRAPARELARRVSASLRRPGGGRPLLRTPAGGPGAAAGEGQPGGPEGVLEALAAAREEAYRAAAHLVVDTEGRTPGQVATAVLAAAGWTERQTR